jgi:hypothetical protein
MNLRLRRAVLCCLLLALMPVLPVHAMGSKKKTAPPSVAKSTPPEAALRAYIERVRAQQAA